MQSLLSFLPVVKPRSLSGKASREHLITQSYRSQDKPGFWQKVSFRHLSVYMWSRSCLSPVEVKYVQARHTSIKLRKKLLKRNLLQSFNNQLASDIKAGSCDILKMDQVTDISVELTVAPRWMLFWSRPVSRPPWGSWQMLPSIIWANLSTKIACRASQGSHPSNTFWLSSYLPIYSCLGH